MALNDFVPARRIAVIAVLSAVLVGLVLFRYAQAMLSPEIDSAVTAAIPERGAILDRNGKILAIQSVVYNIAITRSAIPDKPLFAQLLSPVTGIEEGDLLSRLEAGPADFFYLSYNFV